MAENDLTTYLEENPTNDRRAIHYRASAVAGR